MNAAAQERGCVMLSTIAKPRCKLPTVCSSSYLIGNTVNALTRAGLHLRVREFTEELTKDLEISDYHRVLEIASRYVDFC